MVSWRIIWITRRHLSWILRCSILRNLRLSRDCPSSWNTHRNLRSCNLWLRPTTVRRLIINMRLRLGLRLWVRLLRLIILLITRLAHRLLLLMRLRLLICILFRLNHRFNYFNMVCDCHIIVLHDLIHVWIKIF